MKKTLVYGYGNPGRQDDGLGVLLAEKIEAWAKENGHVNINTDSNYQLNIEDAHGLNDYEMLVFADASVEEIDNFLYEEIRPVMNPRFSMHSVSPEFVIGLCKEMYGNVPKTFLMHIKGYEWEFMENMSEKASENLNKAFNFLVGQITKST